MDTRQQFGTHDRKLISIFEVVGAYFVDIFFNHVHTSAQNNLQRGASITDEYTRRVQAYIVGAKTDEGCYKNIVSELHKYFQAQTRYTTLSFSDLEERIVSQFIPEEYYDLLKAEEKDETLSSTIADLISGLGAYMTTPDMLRRIIDGHDEQPGVTIRMAQDQAITVLLAKRGEIHNKFLRRVGQTKETVSMDVVNDLKTAIRKQAKEKAALKAQLGEAEERVLELEDKAVENKRREAKYRKLLRLVKDEREQGLVGAALAERIPRGSRIAEDDPFDFSQRKPAVPQSSRIAEPGSRMPAAFFAEPTPFATAPPEAVGGRAPRLVAERRPANITDLMSGFGADSAENSGEDERTDSSEGDA